MKTMTDADILAAVHEACEAADRRGENWVDHLPDWIASDHGLSDDPWYVGTLGDGRTIWLRHEDLRGADQYEIDSAPRPCTCPPACDDCLACRDVGHDHPECAPNPTCPMHSS